MTTLASPSISLLDAYEGDSVLPLYVTEVSVTGGSGGHARLSGHAVSEDGELDVRLRLPKALGGVGRGTNPEQLFAAGYGACFHGALALVAEKRGFMLPPDVSIKVKVIFGRDPIDGLFFLEADVSVALPGVPASEAALLLEETEKVSPYAKMTQHGIATRIRLALDA